MADFHQSGVITTLHRLGGPDLERLECELLDYSRTRPIALVLPCLHAELRGPALKGIVEELHRVPYLREVVVSLSGEADRSQFEEMRGLFQDVPCLGGGEPTVIWADGPRIRELLARLEVEGLGPGAD